MTEDDLVVELVDAGVHVIHVPYPLPGAFYARERLVVVDSRCGRVERRCVLAHELAHVRRGDDGPQQDWVETLVDEQAAGMLISPVDYRVAERIYGSHPWQLARELDVTLRIVEAYRRVLTKTVRITDTPRKSYL